MARQRIRLTESQLKNIVRRCVNEARKGRLNESSGASLMVTDEITDLSEFEFWGPAAQNVQELSTDELDNMLWILSDCYPEGITSTKLNDIFAYDFDWVLETLGRNEEEEEEEEEEDYAL